MIINKVSELKHTLGKYDPNLARVFLPFAIKNPKYLKSFIRFLGIHKQTTNIRKEQLTDGVRVPPFLVISITSKCNLRCSGCYAASVGTIGCGNPGPNRQTRSQLNIEQWHSIIKEASELGVLSFLIAGGEPFLLPGLLDICEEVKDRFFVIATNGTSISESNFKRLEKLTNTAVVVSIEGGEEMTDARRGDGVYEKAIKSIQHLTRIGVFTGISVTITKNNYRYWMNPKNIDKFTSQGVRIAAFLEYIPSNSKEESNSLNEDERKEFRAQILDYRKNKPVYIIHSPADEEDLGGCQSAGKGFAHITPAGDLTACPLSNHATHNLVESTLREGLASSLFKDIRANKPLLEMDGKPCALFAHSNEVEELAKSVGAYRTDK